MGKRIMTEVMQQASKKRGFEFVFLSTIGTKYWIPQ